MVYFNPAISIIALNVNDLSTPVKTLKWSNWMKKQEAAADYLQELILKIAGSNLSDLLLT